jgi:DNA-binding LacI/PurR family transcriptional regulator
MTFEGPPPFHIPRTARVIPRVWPCDYPMKPLAHPRRVLLADQVAQAIEAEIAAQRWREWLPSERSLQRILNVSRQTVRAALARLAARKRIVVNPYRGYRIVPLSRTARAKAKAKTVAPAPSRELGLICPEPVYQMPPRFLQVLDIFRALCAEGGLNLEVIEGQRFMRTDPGRLMPRLVRTHPKACWILVLANRRLQEWFAGSGEPAVVYGNVYPGVSLNGTGIDYHACIRHAASHLLTKGHRRIGFVAYDLRRAGEEASWRGFQEACAAHRGDDAVPTLIERPDSDADALCRQLDSALRARHRPTAFVVSHTHHYATVATHLALRGLHVPDDVSLICRSEDPFLQFMRPTPAFYRANMEVAARLLFERVRHAIDGTAKPGDQRLLIPELVQGGSVAAPSAANLQV